jgi:hypothetical protein
VSIQPGTGSDSITVNSGTFTIAAAASAASPTVLSLASLSISSGAALDLSNNELLVSGSTLAGIGALVQSGQIETTTPGLTIGYMNGAGGAVEVRATLLADSNLDGKVDVTDLGNLASNYGAASGATWVQGDTNHDGKVDVTDLGNLASNYGGSLASGPSASPSAEVAAATGPKAAPARVSSSSSPVAVGGATSVFRQSSDPLRFESEQPSGDDDVLTALLSKRDGRHSVAWLSASTRCVTGSR